MRLQALQAASRRKTQDRRHKHCSFLSPEQGDTANNQARLRVRTQTSHNCTTRSCHQPLKGQLFAKETLAGTPELSFREFTISPTAKPSQFASTELLLAANPRYQPCSDIRMAPQFKHGRSNDSVVQSSSAEIKSSLVTPSANSQSPPARRRPRFSFNRSKPLKSYIPPNLRSCVLPYHGDFCVSPHYFPPMIAQLMAEGFLPIATEGYLLPKLHAERCVISLPDALHVSKSVRKKAKRFHMTVNQCMDRVVEGCREQHGATCWLYAPLVAAFENIHQHGREGFVTRVGDKATACPVRLYSVEVWDENNDLVAGELGYTVGSIFTSLTGFSRQDSAGSAQLAALGRLLGREGFTLWDLGMDMDYKRVLGSHLMPREEFVEFVHSVRVSSSHCALPVLEPSSGVFNCRDIIDGTNVSAAASKAKAVAT